MNVQKSIKRLIESTGNEPQLMKNYPDQLKMLKELLESNSISESEYEAMLEILLREVDAQNDQFEEHTTDSNHKTTKQKRTVKQQPTIPFEPAINSDSEIATLKQSAKTIILGAQLYNLLYGFILLGVLFIWRQVLSNEGFWEQFVFFCFLSFLFGTIYESKISAWIYSNMSALLNLSIFSRRKIQEKLHVDDPVFLYVSDSRNADAQRVLNKIIQYFFLYRFGLLLLYKILINTVLEPLPILEKILFFEELNSSGVIFYYEIMLLIGIKIYFVFKSIRSGYSLKKELLSSFSKHETRNLSNLATEVQFFFPNENNSYFGPFSRKQVKHFIGMKLIYNDATIKNGLGVIIDKVQFIR